MCDNAMSSARAASPRVSTPPVRSTSRPGPTRSRPTTSPGARSRIWRRILDGNAAELALLDSILIHSAYLRTVDVPHRTENAREDNHTGATGRPHRDTRHIG